VNRNCGRATDRGEEAGSEVAGRRTETGSEAESIRASGQRTAKLSWPKVRLRKSGGRARKGSVLTWGRSRLRLERATRSMRSEKSAEVVVARDAPAGMATRLPEAGRAKTREGPNGRESRVRDLGGRRHQKPAEECGALARTIGVKPRRAREAVKRQRRRWSNETQGRPAHQPTEPPDADPHVRWCGRGVAG
jgi:hypothetical protein